MRVHLAALQRGEHGVAGEQRDLALRGIATEQHGDLAEILRLGRADLRSGGVVLEAHQLSFLVHRGALAYDSNFRVQAHAVQLLNRALHVCDQRFDIRGRSPRRD